MNAVTQYTIDGVKYMTLKRYAVENDVDVKHVRKCARADEPVGHFVKFGATWGIQIDTVLPEPTSKKSPNGARYVIHIPNGVNVDDVLNTLKNMYVIVTDPRIASKQRRDAKKAVALAVKSNIMT